MKKKIISIITTIVVALMMLLVTGVKDWIDAPKTTTSQNQTSVQVNDTNYPTWSYDQYPEYYLVSGPAVIDEAKFPEPGTITYAEKDNLGRTQAVYGTITLDMVYKSSAEERPDFKKGDDPSGWTKNEEVNVETKTGLYDGWFWNRSHLIADRLGGEATSFNAITGTRMQNVGSRTQTGGMYYIEEKTVDYLRTHRSSYIYYSATPIYIDDELIPRYVIVDVQSSTGDFSEHVITFNNQNGYTINYKTGQYTKN